MQAVISNDFSSHEVARFSQYSLCFNYLFFYALFWEKQFTDNG